MNNATEKLFETDSYLKKFTAKIVSVNNNAFTLDRTCFYPESGGQPGDSGFFNNIEVVDTKYCKETNSILHISNNIIGIETGMQGDGVINWDRRYKIMRLHSALHMLYLFFTKQYGECKLRGSNVQADKARLDVEYFDEIDKDLLAASINESISNNIAIITYPEGNNANKRCWEISGFPPIPCGGTHISNSSEIGRICCSVTSKGKQGKRIYISIEQ